MFKEFCSIFYNSLMRPKNIIENNSESIKLSFLVYILSQVSIAISFMYSLSYRAMPFKILSTTILFILYFLFITVINFLVINSVALFVSNKKQKNSSRVFLSSIFQANAIFILITPLSLLFSFLSNNIFKSVMYLIYFIMSIYYFCIVVKIVKNNFEIKNSFNAVLITIAPVLINFLHFFIFLIFYAYIVVSIIA